MTQFFVRSSYPFALSKQQVASLLATSAQSGQYNTAKRNQPLILLVKGQGGQGRKGE